MNNKNVFLIMGASSDLGTRLIENICEESKSEITIIAHYYSACDRLEQIKQRFPDINFIFMRADMANSKEVFAFIRRIKDNGISPNYIVDFCAREYCFRRFSEWDTEYVNIDMSIQVYAFAEVLKAFLPDMVKNAYGKIVVMLSAAIIGTPPKNLSAYLTVKYALWGLIKSIASDYGDSGININAISPSMINTKFIKGIGRKIKEMSAAQNPRHKNLEVEDVVPIILFLLSDKADFINGANINLSARAD